MYLSKIITDQTVFLYNHSRDRTQGLITYTEQIHMLGKLFSAILSAVRTRGYRIRLFMHSAYDGSQQSWPLRFFGCLSRENGTLETNLNRSLRLSNFTALHKLFNPQVQHDSEF